MTAVALASIAIPAAATTFTHLGVDCQFTSQDTFQRQTSGSVSNQSTVRMDTLWCPLDIVASMTGITAVSATVVDHSTADNVMCDLYIYNADGLTQYLERQVTSGSSSTAVTLSWNLAGKGFLGNHGHLVCYIPRIAGIGNDSSLRRYSVTN
jgi:hypothetical protein